MSTLYNQLHFVEKLTPQQIDEHAAQTHHLWGGKRSLDNRQKSLQDWLVRFSSSFWMSGLIDRSGCLVASLKRYYYTVVMGEKNFRCLGLGAVYTVPEYRRKGIAAAMIHQVCHQSFHHQQSDLVMLYSDIAPSFYQRLGFELIPSVDASLERKDLLKGQDEDNLNETFTPLDHVSDELITFYSSQIRRQNSLTLLRSSNDWVLFKVINGLAETNNNEAVLYQNQQIIALLTYSEIPEKKMLWVEELVFEPGKEIAVRAALAKLMMRQKLETLGGWHSSVAELGFTSTSKQRQSAVTMIKSLRPEVNFTKEQLTYTRFQSLHHF